MKEILEKIADVKDYPKKGIIFKDLTPLLQDKKAYSLAIDAITKAIKSYFPNATHIVSPEARGFWFGCPAAINAGLGFIPVRKLGKLPRETKTISYVLEYGTENLCMHSDALKKGDTAVIIDDVLATGGTLAAIEELVKQTGATVAGSVILLELSFLNGKAAAKEKVVSIITI